MIETPVLSAIWSARSNISVPSPRRRYGAATMIDPIHATDSSYVTTEAVEIRVSSIQPPTVRISERFSSRSQSSIRAPHPAAAESSAASATSSESSGSYSMSMYSHRSFALKNEEYDVWDLTSGEQDTFHSKVMRDSRVSRFPPSFAVSMPRLQNSLSTSSVGTQPKSHRSTAVRRGGCHPGY